MSDYLENIVRYSPPHKRSLWIIVKRKSEDSKMKAVTQGITRSAEFGLKSDAFKINKHSSTDVEITACYMKLKELVPSVPQNKKISKTQLLQHVIDYIYDLELSLDFQPMVFSSTPREPLSEKPEQNKNVFLEPEDMDSEDDCERPPSK